MCKNDINGNLISELRTLKGCMSSRGEELIENALKKIMFHLTLPKIGPIFLGTLANQELQGSL